MENNKTLLETAADNEHQARLYDKIADVLKNNWIDKTINARIKTQLQKELPQYYVLYGKEYSWRKLTVYGNGLTYNESVSVRFSETGDMWRIKTEPLAILDAIDQAEARAGHCRTHAEQLRKESAKLASLILEVADIQEKIDAFKAKNDLSYKVREIIKEKVNASWL